MKRIPAAFLLALLSVSMAVPACHPSPNPTTPGGAFVDCTRAAVKDSAQGLLGNVATALATGDYAAELAKLIGRFGRDEVTCAVQFFVDSLHRKAAYDALAATELKNGEAWLKAQGQTQ